MNQRTSVNGLFEIVRTKAGRHVTATSRLILVCRGGQLFGADPEGRVYWGRLMLQDRRTVRLFSLLGTHEVPLRRCSRLRAMSRIRLPITGEVDPWAPSQNATVRVGGRKIAIEITYLCPLPR